MAATTVSLERQVQCIRTIGAIARSNLVARYLIGYTSRGGWKRFSHYRSLENCNHLVVIADALTFQQASILEINLQSRLWADGRSVLFRKYDPGRRDKRGAYSAPSFIHKGRNDETVHCIYMAWWERTQTTMSDSL
jgi:hypothetical protein